MKKQRIVIASVLKPVDDTRMYEKMGVTLAQSGDYDIFIFGQSTNNIPVHPSIRFIGLKRVRRMSFARLWIPIKLCLKLIKVRPHILIVNTHELLIVSILNRIFFGSIIVYDIRENYYRNIKYSEAFPSWIKSPLALWVKLKEKLAAPLFHHFILAEKTYRQELTFIHDRFTVLENKAMVHGGFQRRPDPNLSRLLFTGTIAKSTGIFEAIDLAEALHQLEPIFKLYIVGNCAIAQTRNEITKRIQDKPYIILKGFDQLVPHMEIMDEISRADFGIMYYPPLPHTLGAAPTKLYEYMACQLPILTWSNQTYTDQIQQNLAGIIINDSISDLLSEIKVRTFYPQAVKHVLWESEKFISIIENLQPALQAENSIFKA